MRSHFYSFVMSAFFLLPYEVYSDSACDSSMMDGRSCDVHCNSIWGRVPLFNIPWSYGECAKEKSCVCRFNQKDLHQFTSNPCIQRSVWSSSFKGKRKIVSKEIKAQVVRLDSRQRFEVFKSAYGKQYGSQGEDLKRYDIFRKNLVIIEELMARRKGNVVFGVGPFTDFTSEEFRRFVGIKKLRRRHLRPRMLNLFSRRTPSTNGQKPRRTRSLSPPPPRPGHRPAHKRSVSVPPSYQPAPHNYKPWVGPDPQGQILLDWRIPDHLYPPTEAQTQFGRECDACWAFSTVGAVDIKLSRMVGRIGKVAVQALIDCDSQNYGCNGGNMEGALYFMKNNGVPSATVYPYRAKTEVCKNYSPSVKTDYEEVDPEKVEERLMYSPLPSAIYFDPILQHYISGVFDSEDCDIDDYDDTNHAAVIVGHYEDSWIIRDSMPTNWGLQGHWLVMKGRCGVGVRSYELKGPYPAGQNPTQTDQNPQQASSSKRKRLDKSLIARENTNRV